MNVKNPFFNYNNNKIDFKGIDKEVDSKTLKDCADKTVQILCDRAEREVSDYGTFSVVEEKFICPENKDTFTVFIKPDDEDKKVRYLNIGIEVPASDRMYQAMLSHGSKKDILDFLKSDECSDKIAAYAKMLQKKLNG